MKNKSAPSKGRDKSIRKRLTGTVLIPSVTLLVMWTAMSSYFVVDAFYVKEVAIGVQEVSIPAVTALSSAEKERQLGLATLGHPNNDLYAQQQQTDRSLAAMRAAMGPVLEQAPKVVVDHMTALNNSLDQLPVVRSEIASGALTNSQVNDYYNNMLNVATSLFDTQARIEPDLTATQGGIAATSVFRASDLMSRQSSLVSAALVSGAMSPADHLQFTTLIGSYHSELDKTAPYLRPDVANDYQRLTESVPWKRLVDAENTLVEHGPWTGRNEAPPISAADWQSLTNQVSQQLTDLTIRQADEVATQAVMDGNNQLMLSVIGSVFALLVVLVSIIVAIRVSGTLVDRALVTRLERLRNDALDLARTRLPGIVTRLREGESVDVQAELPRLDHGQDEIGGVAEAFNIAQQTAVQAAISEAHARNGVHKVFLGIARRSQRLAHRQLNLLGAMENREEDPTQQENLFQLDHLATRERRNAENLIILGGGQPGRRWRNPARLIDVLRAAKAETEQYSRVRVEAIPDVAITGTAIADTIHLVAELIDNATSFSPPGSQVDVTSTRVARGVAVEITDQGLGMKDETRESANEMMTHPPEFDAMALRADSSLGLFVVARLATRQGIKVKFDESRYGGTRATALIPTHLLSSDRAPGEEIETGPSTPAAVAEPDSSRRDTTVDDDAQQTSDPVETAVNGAEFAKRDITDLIGTSAPDRLTRVTGNIEVPGDIEVAKDNEQSAAHEDQSATQDENIDTPRPPLPERKPGRHLAAQLLDTPQPENVERDQLTSRTRNTLVAFRKGSSAGREDGDESTNS